MEKKDENHCYRDNSAQSAPVIVEPQHLLLCFIAPSSSLYFLLLFYYLRVKTLALYL